MSAVCPACGVAVVPGYVRCPKCHAALPYGGGRIARTTIDPGGTSVDSGGRFPIAAIVIALAVAGGIVAFFGLRGGKKTEPVPTPVEATQAAQPRTTPSRAPTPTVETPTTPAAPSAMTVAADIERALKRQRLWGTVDVIGSRLDVRSGACGDPAMGPLLDSARDALHAAGVTKLRCVEQSGAVVFARDL